ncbi:MAG: xanthine dehydrogenase family protein molybdopterin-binding subunit, partial [Chloroflexota bacterium]
MTQESTYKYLGKPHRLVEGLDKVTGRAEYAADVKLPGALHARPIFSPYAHATIVSIDKSEAEQMPGVVAVLTADDLPTKGKVMSSRNSAVLADGKVFFLGQPVAVVVGETEAATQDAADYVYIDYDPLPAAVETLAAMTDEAPTVWADGFPTEESDLSAMHSAVDAEGQAAAETFNNVHATEHFERGNVEKAFAEADVVIERTYNITAVHQGYMEPHATIVEPDPLRGTLTYYTGTQGQFVVRNEVSQILGLPKSKVRVIPKVLGGGFGAKYGILEPLAGAIALTLHRPIRIQLTRSEDFLTTTPSPKTIITLKTGATKNGALTALKAKIIMDNGIFKFALGGLVAALLGGLYKCENTHLDVYEVNTNKPPIGAYRAPGAPQASFAMESNMDDMADQLGLDRLEFRLMNAVESGDLMGNNDPWPPLGLKKCLERMKSHPAWQEQNKAPNEGIGIAVGGWPSFMGPAGAVCQVNSDGTVRVQVGSVDISGVNSSFVLIAAEALGISPDQVEIIQEDTRSAPFAPQSGG